MVAQLLSNFSFLFLVKVNKLDTKRVLSLANIKLYEGLVSHQVRKAIFDVGEIFKFKPITDFGKRKLHLFGRKKKEKSNENGFFNNDTSMGQRRLSPNIHRSMWDK